MCFLLRNTFDLFSDIIGDVHHLAGFTYHPVSSAGMLAVYFAGQSSALAPNLQVCRH
jgi:hypothetical protein